jgi:Mg2+ and Co2+ transporter CorA
MLEQTAETLDKLHRNVMRDDAQRRLIGDQIQGLGRELAAFADLSRDERRVLGALAKDQNELAPALKSLVERQGEVDESMHEHIRNLDSNIKRLVDEVVNGREQLVDEIRDELRVIGRALTAESHARSRSHKQKAG